MQNFELPIFNTKSEIVQYLQSFDPIKYARSRNYLNGGVSYLSPYINLGLITLREIVDITSSRYKINSSEKWIQELSWRDYFISVHQAKLDEIFTPLKNPQTDARSFKMPSAIVEGCTGITAIDNAIHKLYQTGYLHNHERMWLASIVCNVAKVDWLTGAKWMYSHLIDGNYASNMLSWQWVAGTFSSKKYYANQENINKYSLVNQKNTFLDIDYSNFEDLKVPDILIPTMDLDFEKVLVIPHEMKFIKPECSSIILINENTINEIYNLKDKDVILFISQENQAKYPMSKAKWNLIIRLLKNNLPNAKICVGDSDIIANFYKLYDNVEIAKIQRLYPTLDKYYSSFFQFWKQVEKLSRITQKNSQFK